MLFRDSFMLNYELKAAPCLEYSQVLSKKVVVTFLLTNLCLKCVDTRTDYIWFVHLFSLPHCVMVLLH